MTDDVKKVVAWLRRTAGGVPHLETLLAHIDGEPARLAAACEEQREACVRITHAFLHAQYDLLTVEQRRIGLMDSLRATPLDATPLADELRTLRARVAELEAQLGGMTEQWKAELNHANAWMRKHQAADKKLLDVHDSLHRECNGPVDLGREIRDMRSALEQRVGDLRKMYESAERDAAARYDCKGGPGTTAPACGGCVTCLHRVIEQAEARAEKAEAQVAAARAECARIHDVHPMEDAYTAATNVLRAMDEAVKK